MEGCIFDGVSASENTNTRAACLFSTYFQSSFSKKTNDDTSPKFRKKDASFGDEISTVYPDASAVCFSTSSAQLNFSHKFQAECAVLKVIPDPSAT